MKGVLIAGTSSGVGKTTVTLAIIAAMRRQGLTVQPFKAGPDFLDTGHHSRIAGRIARNLDTWMLSAEENREVLEQSSRDAEVVVVEGMMGVFDGKDGVTEAGSSAEIAKLLKLPVVLVVDAGKSARSIAAVVLGFEVFDPELTLAGVVLNRVASDRHYRMLEAAIQSSCNTPIFGWLPTEPGIAIPERHLGLRTVEEFDGGEGSMQQVEKLAAFAEERLNLAALLSLECGLCFSPARSQRLKTDDPPVRIGVARDRAFSFYYEDNLDLLRQHGAEVVSFSPLDDDTLPLSLDALYFGGGYPELYADKLSSNKTMLASIRSFLVADRPVYAECGGMMYLSEQLTATDGAHYAMVGFLPMAIEMTSKLSQFGYVTVDVVRDCLLGPSGTTIRGHSFHYSRIVGARTLATSYIVQYSLAGRQEAEGFTRGNTLASYIHLHFRAAPQVARNFVAFARAVKARELATT